MVRNKVKIIFSTRLFHKLLLDYQSPLERFREYFGKNTSKKSLILPPKGLCHYTENNILVTLNESSKSLHWCQTMRETSIKLINSFS